MPHHHNRNTFPRPLSHHSLGFIYVGEAGVLPPFEIFESVNICWGSLVCTSYVPGIHQLNTKTHLVSDFVELIFINFIGPVRLLSLTFCGEENFCKCYRVEPPLLPQYCLQLPFNSRSMSHPYDKARFRPSKFPLFCPIND